MREGEGAGLPSPGTSFVGRATERAAGHAALAEARLVTLVGPAGVGKTRLAITVASEAGARFPFGCAFAELVSVRSDFLAQAVATPLGVTERPGQPLEQALHERLSRGPCLLVVDSGEHVLDAVAGLVGRLLAGCPQLVVLATSSERLGIIGERVLAVPPLALVGKPTTGSSWSEAETLFLDRARATDADFEADPELVGELCSLLEGIPLAIELAAARARSLGLAGLRAGLADHLRLFPGGGNVDGGRRLLRAVIDWSYELLDDDERRLFRRLGVFVRGFDLDAISRVGTDGDPDGAADLLGRLADKSLLVREREGAVGRWRMLETVRVHALERLAAAGEERELRARHLEWAIATAVELERLVEAGRPWRSRFDLVVDDLRAALHTSPGPGHAEHRLARTLGHLCYARQFLLEARQRFQQAAAYALDESAAAAVLRAGADVAMAEHRGEPAFQLLKESAQHAGYAADDAAQAIALALAVCIGSRFPATFTEEIPHEQLCRLLEEAQRVAPPNRPLVAAYLAAAEAWNATGLKTTPDAELAQTALRSARVADDQVLIMGALDAVISGNGATGRFRECQRLGHERIQHFDRLSRHDPRTGVEIIDTLHVAPLVAVAAGDLARAVAAAHRAWDDPFSGLYMRASKQVVPLALCGRFDEALSFAATMWDGWQRVGRPAARWMAPAVHAAALVHGLRGQADGHREWLNRARWIAAPRGQDHISDSFAAFADPRLALHAGAIDDALATSVDLSGMPPWPEAAHQLFDAYSWAIAAEVAVVAGLPDAGDRLAAAAPAGAESAWAAACLARATGRLHDDQDALTESLAGWDRIGARFERASTLLLLPDRAAEGLAELTSLGCELPSKPGFPLGIDR
jgi:predicted ATPase